MYVIPENFKRFSKNLRLIKTLFRPFRKNGVDKLFSVTQFHGASGLEKIPNTGVIFSPINYRFALYTTEYIGGILFRKLQMPSISFLYAFYMPCISPRYRGYILSVHKFEEKL